MDKPPPAADRTIGGAVITAATRVAALVQFAPDPIIGFTVGGEVTDFNPAAERVYGYAAAEIIGRSVDLIVAPELSADGLFARLAAGETIVAFDTQCVTRSGARIDVSISMSPIIDDLGEVVGVAAFSHDIGFRLRDDERVRRSETLLAEAQELASVGSWEWDVKSNEMTWSAQLFRILALDPSKTEPSFDVYFGQIHPDDRARAESQLITMAATGRNTLENIRMLGGDGIERITQTYSRSTKDAAGNVLRVRGTTQDVSLLARASGRLERANRHNEALLNSAGDGIYGIDRYGITTFANPAAALLTGYDVEAMVGRSRHDAFHHTRPDGTAYSPYDCPVSASLEDGTVHRCDTDVYWRKDGSSFPVEYTSTPIFEAGAVVGAVVVFKDISERRELERARDDFVASITHELRTPLTSIRGYLELIADEASAGLSDEHRRFLAIVDRNADRLLHVVGDLLLVAQADAGAIELELEDIDVAALIRHGVEVARPQAAAKRPRPPGRGLPGAPAARRPRAARPGRRQPRLQRDQVHARRGPGRAAVLPGRRSQRDRGLRHGAGDVGRRTGPALRALLPHRGGLRARDRGHGPGPDDRQGARRGARRDGLRHERDRRRDHVPRRASRHGPAPGAPRAGRTAARQAVGAKR